MIRFEPKFNKSDIQAMLNSKKEAIRQAIILRLKRIGETFIKNARENGNYKDRTGNLRSSIGYVILENGVQLSQSFPGSKNVGKQRAKDAINEAKEEFSRGFVLIVVAGMEYAAAVESRGKDVLTASSLIAENDLRIAIKEISSKISA
jgi:hypothetical protein